ncbi:hypothetical protein BLNAU_597 [Blattamonas nauphoetae]|uniref:Uncharacterized protein n=1 Tax=Blattamonas nauphoetae TaxID=2049346 RepID=A0ABQ9YLP7_9EUKA|nr:hypothetical protein BLNAU_597 [Blattamonas nauphoetae]
MASHLDTAQSQIREIQKTVIDSRQQRRGISLRQAPTSTLSMELICELDEVISQFQLTDSDSLTQAFASLIKIFVNYRDTPTSLAAIYRHLLYYSAHILANMCLFQSSLTFT